MIQPTVKPVALIADAIKDCSRRGEIILDMFAGSGSTLIAAEKTGRCARLIEFDPLYCDTIIRRWPAYTGKLARLQCSQLSFDDVADARNETITVTNTGGGLPDDHFEQRVQYRLRQPAKVRTVQKGQSGNPKGRPKTSKANAFI